MRNPCRSRSCSSLTGIRAADAEWRAPTASAARNAAICVGPRAARRLHAPRRMREPGGEQRLLLSARRLRLVLQRREAKDIVHVENITFAFARDAGLRGVDLWLASACAALLGRHVGARGGGELELRVAGEPRAALELIARDEGPALDGLSALLLAARDCASQLHVARHVSAGSIVTARFWLRGQA